MDQFEEAFTLCTDATVRRWHPGCRGPDRRAGLVRPDPAARSAARLLLLRLVRLGEDTRATRRRGIRRQLSEESTDPDKTEESLEALVRARLVTLDAEFVEITHEALLTAWPRLREWIDEDRGAHRLRQRLEEDSGPGRPPTATPPSSTGAPGSNRPTPGRSRPATPS